MTDKIALIGLSPAQMTDTFVQMGLAPKAAAMRARALASAPPPHPSDRKGSSRARDLPFVQGGGGTGTNHLTLLSPPGTPRYNGARRGTDTIYGIRAPHEFIEWLSVPLGRKRTCARAAAKCDHHRVCSARRAGTPQNAPNRKTVNVSLSRFCLGEIFPHMLSCFCAKD